MCLLWLDRLLLRVYLCWVLLIVGVSVCGFGAYVMVWFKGLVSGECGLVVGGL